MAPKNKRFQIYTYDCVLTGASFKRTRSLANTADLVSVKGYYQLNPDKDDRPDFIKQPLGEVKAAKTAPKVWIQLVELGLRQKKERLAQEALRAQYLEASKK